MGCFRVACAASGIEIPTYSAELPREASGEAAVDILSQSSRGYPARKLQQSRARYFCQPCLSNVLSNLLFDPIEMGFVVFSLMRKR